jgi:hypothetical protein
MDLIGKRYGAREDLWSKDISHPSGVSRYVASADDVLFKPGTNQALNRLT